MKDLTEAKTENINEGPMVTDGRGEGRSETSEGSKFDFQLTIAAGEAILVAVVVTLEALI